MKMPRTAFARTLSSGLLGILSRTCMVAVPVVVASTCIVGCADENDPKTWVKRLDDPAQRAPAIKRLDEMFNAAMGSSNNNREEAKVKAVVDDAIEGLAKTYTAGGLDEKTRKDLMKLIADMGDQRAAPAFAKAFKDYEPGKNDEDVKFASQGTSRISNAGKLTDQPLIDALWDCFAKFQPSKAKSINLVKDLQGAVKTIKHPSWGPKAVALLNAPVNDPKNPEQGMDQLQFWQLTAVQLIGDTKFTAGVGPLVKVLMTPTKKDLTFPVRLALHKMPKEAEPELIKALKGRGRLREAGRGVPREGVPAPHRRAARVHLAARRPRGHPGSPGEGRQRSEPHDPRDVPHVLPDGSEEREGLHRRVREDRPERSDPAHGRRERPRDPRGHRGELLRSEPHRVDPEGGREREGRSGRRDAASRRSPPR